VILSKLDAAHELLARRAARKSLIGFTQYVKHDYEAAAHHIGLAAALERVERRETMRLLVCMPPRHGKSCLISEHFPAWYIGKRPGHEIIAATYGGQLSMEFGRKVRNLVASPKYHTIFPETALAADSQAVDRWHVMGESGGYLAASIGTAMTGHGADVLLIDDPVKDRAEAESENIRRNIWEWYTSVAYTRLMPGAAVVLVATRWHEEDLAGMLIAREHEKGADKWEKLILPAIDVEGKALWPSRFPLEELNRIKSQDEYTWEALYMQRPRAPGGSFFSERSLLVEDPEWEAPFDRPDALPRMIPVETPKRIDTVFATVDTAVKTGQQHSGLGTVYLGYCSTGITPYPLTILDYDYTQVEGQFLEVWLPNVFRRLEELATECQAIKGSSGVYIEDKATGMVLLQQAKSNQWDAHAISGKLTAMGKSERAINISGYVHRGDVKFSEPAYKKAVTYLGVTKNHLLAQILSFRAGDLLGQMDLLDCFSYGVALALAVPGELLDEN
jgi:hypothetical protein